MSFLPRIFGTNQDFPKSSVWGVSHFSKYLGRKRFGEEFGFSDFCPGGVLFLTIYNVCRHFRHDDFVEINFQNAGGELFLGRNLEFLIWPGGTDPR